MMGSRTSTTLTPFGFAGSVQYQSDGDSGLMLLGNRYYDPSIGRFISSDPAEAGTNWYAYCGNNPLGGVDPAGLFKFSLSLGALFILPYVSGWADGMIVVDIQPFRGTGDLVGAWDPVRVGAGYHYGSGRGNGIYGGIGVGAGFDPDPSPITTGPDDGYVAGLAGGAGTFSLGFSVTEPINDDGQPGSGACLGLGLKYGWGIGAGQYDGPQRGHIWAARVPIRELAPVL